MRRVQIECLGVFRELGDSIEVDVAGETIGDVRAALSKHLEQASQSELTSTLARSVFASGDQMCRDGDPCPDTVIAVLPPVAGG